MHVVGHGFGALVMVVGTMEMAVVGEMIVVGTEDVSVSVVGEGVGT